MTIDLSNVQSIAKAAIDAAALVHGNALAGVPVATEGSSDFGSKVQSAESKEGISVRLWTPLGLSAITSGRGGVAVRYLLTVIIRETPKQLKASTGLGVQASAVVMAVMAALLVQPEKPHPIHFELTQEDWLDRNEAEGGSIDHVLRFVVQGIVLTT